MKRYENINFMYSVCAWTGYSLLVLVDRLGSSITLLMEGAWLKERLLKLRPLIPAPDDDMPERGGRDELLSSGELSFVKELKEKKMKSTKVRTLGAGHAIERSCSSLYRAPCREVKTLDIVYS